MTVSKQADLHPTPWSWPVPTPCGPVNGLPAPEARHRLGSPQPQCSLTRTPCINPAPAPLGRWPGTRVSRLRCRVRSIVRSPRSETERRLPHLASENSVRVTTPHMKKQEEGECQRDFLSLWVRWGRQEASQISPVRVTWLAELVPQTLACHLTCVTSDKVFEVFKSLVPQL